ncbi:MAG: hypothetical protein A2951_00145 [Candidatus Buchananbacteria bacterium RIFCSPLOWO2_01_FULL_56_15]|uniref:Uncharacterized protein n=2 Tax=Candidatus Buchananiibacteriota TaxID=1817903 RepID=A0A1G1YGY8_9BACT|nr:MAG: hypothetical protein A3J59_00590 [Candidatus Buchananbacteria bacterium RIFCSPHIGHO2_02_FULL_56_16]OGY55016.1 MAG: hypothetical protein A2951_00145 [Candidatus Buchananbacteria bacterium RIFCSPLOWO2_01_FULL_56_15]
MWLSIGIVIAGVARIFLTIVTVYFTLVLGLIVYYAIMVGVIWLFAKVCEALEKICERRRQPCG